MNILELYITEPFPRHGIHHRCKVFYSCIYIVCPEKDVHNFSLGKRRESLFLSVDLHCKLNRERNLQLNLLKFTEKD